MSMKHTRTPAQLAADLKRTGRRPVPLSKKRHIQISVAMTEAENALLEREARELKLSVSELLMRPWRKES